MQVQFASFLMHEKKSLCVGLLECADLSICWPQSCVCSEARARGCIFCCFVWKFSGSKNTCVSFSIDLKITLQSPGLTQEACCLGSYQMTSYITHLSMKTYGLDRIKSSYERGQALLCRLCVYSAVGAAGQNTALLYNHRTLQ